MFIVLDVNESYREHCIFLIFIRHQTRLKRNSDKESSENVFLSVISVTLQNLNFLLFKYYRYRVLNFDSLTVFSLYDL